MVHFVSECQSFTSIKSGEKWCTLLRNKWRPLQRNKWCTFKRNRWCTLQRNRGALCSGIVATFAAEYPIYYNKAKIVREYLNELETKALNNQLTIEVQDWLKWAKDKTDWFDPMIKKRISYYMNPIKKI